MHELLDRVEDCVDVHDWTLDALIKMNDDRPALVSGEEIDDLGTVVGRAYRLAMELKDAAKDFKKLSAELLAAVAALRKGEL